MNIKQSNRCSRGFTLIEMIVSLGLFTVILFIATNAFLLIVNADRKSRSVRMAMDNLNIALEDMSRRIKTGTVYSCGGGAVVADCPTGSDVFAFDDQTGDRTTYSTSSTCGVGYGSTGCVMRANSSGTFPITGPEINVTRLLFIVRGSDSTDNTQPSVVISFMGSLPSVGSSPGTILKVQTIITQRAYDA